MNNRDKVVIGSAILVVLAVLMVLNNSITYSGQGIRSGECYDTDGGNNIFVKGTISGHVYPSQEQFKYIDYCLPNELDSSGREYILKEYMCMKDVSDVSTTDRSAWKSELVVCDNGCKQGACLR